jgi:hypothetical protein
METQENRNPNTLEGPGSGLDAEELRRKLTEAEEAQTVLANEVVAGVDGSTDERAAAIEAARKNVGFDVITAPKENQDVVAPPSAS